jgi:hypothetical protein
MVKHFEIGQPVGIFAFAKNKSSTAQMEFLNDSGANINGPPAADAALGCLSNASLGERGTVFAMSRQTLRMG